jgi:hypothetical protein
VDWLIGVLKEVIERCRRARPVIGPDGEPTGEYRKVRKEKTERTSP